MKIIPRSRVPTSGWRTAAARQRQRRAGDDGGVALREPR